jgi:hypothetical protein
MRVILCHPDDQAALWLAQTLAADATDLTVVSVEELVFSRSIVHRMTSRGDTGAVRLADGRTLRPESIAGLVNRVRYLPTQHFAHADTAERAYATAELSAFLLAWLNGIRGRVLNPPRPFALGGGVMYPAAVTHAAATAGLPTGPWFGSTSGQGIEAPRPAITHAVTVLDNRIYGPLLPRQMQDGCVRLSVLLGVPLLQVLLHHAPDAGWRFVDATPFVDFQAAGPRLARDLARALLP